MLVRDLRVVTNQDNLSEGRGSRKALPQEQCPVRHQRRAVQGNHGLIILSFLHSKFLAFLTNSPKNPGNCSCRRKPVSVSYNFITLISDLRVTSSAGVNLFTMQSARYKLLTTRFTLSVKTVRAPKERLFDIKQCI